MSIFRAKRIYLDHAAATRVAPRVLRAMEGFYSKHFYNPSAVYDEGMEVSSMLESARTSLARLLHAGSKDIIFTSGGTESDNLAIFGTFEYSKDKVSRPHIIVLEHEHPAILEAARLAEERGAELSIVPTSEIIGAIKENTVLVSASLVHGETGEVLNAKDIGRAIRSQRRKSGSEFPYFHLDASQAALTEDLNVDTLQTDLLTLDAAKIYGPKGSGALVVRPWVKLRPILVGGGQERGLRSGTQNVAGCIGLAKALELADALKQANIEHFRKLRSEFVGALERDVPGLKVNGGATVAPHIVSITMPGKLHEFIVISLAEKGVLASTGSSCSSQKNEDDKEAVRFSFGIDTSVREVREAARILKEILL